jgi:hypothetical protein
MFVTDQQVRLLMETYERTGVLETASAKSAMCRQTGAKYLGGAPLPSKTRKDLSLSREWRTREDPLAGIWDKAVEMLTVAPGLEAKALFEYICRQHPGLVDNQHLRTFQRRVRSWRVTAGPEKEVFFQQNVQPGRRLSLDFTHMESLGITINGVPFPHQACNCVLAYSGWSWGTVCFSESLIALRTGLQAALFRLGRVPLELWTDNSTSATHNPAAGEQEARPFNQRYLDLVQHFGLEPHTINIGKSHENGSVESNNGHLKRRLEQHLLLRGSRDFSSREEYVRFLNMVQDQANHERRKHLCAELNVMRELKASRMAEWDDQISRVLKWSVIHVNHNIYSVPSRLIGEKVDVRVYEDLIRIYYNGVLQLEAPRLLGRGNSLIDYRHVIRSLVRKPGAFRDYRYKAEMFPTLNFRKAFDRLCEICGDRTADIEYLRILKLAADTLESAVDEVLARLLAEDKIPRWGTVEEFVEIPHRDTVPDIRLAPVELADYDRLINEVTL